MEVIEHLYLVHLLLLQFADLILNLTYVFASNKFALLRNFVFVVRDFFWRELSCMILVGK